MYQDQELMTQKNLEKPQLKVQNSDVNLNLNMKQRISQDQVVMSWKSHTHSVRRLSSWVHKNDLIYLFLNLQEKIRGPKVIKQ